MNAKSSILEPDLEFSYSQFFIYDPAVGVPSCDWTNNHVRQGFARRDLVIAVGTLLEFGTAEVRITTDSVVDWSHCQRVIAVPLEIISGQVAVDGPEEYPIKRCFDVACGFYRVTIGQRIVAGEREEITIDMSNAFSRINTSEILVSDKQLNPPSPLIETADEVKV